MLQRSLQHSRWFSHLLRTSFVLLLTAWQKCQLSGTGRLSVDTVRHSPCTCKTMALISRTTSHNRGYMRAHAAEQP